MEGGHSRVVAAKGAQLFCTAFGEGDPIIVLHGGGGWLTHDYLLPRMAALGSKKRRAILYDQRACGRSTGDISGNAASFATYVEDVAAVQQAFGYEKTVLLGHSWGGFLALHYALVHPEAVRALILISSVPTSLEELLLFRKEVDQRDAPHRAELDKLKIEAGESYLRLQLLSYLASAKDIDLLNLEMRPEANRNRDPVRAIFDRAISERPDGLYEALQHLATPTLIVHGDVDPISPSVAERLHKSIPGSSYVLFEQCGHFPYVEVPDRFFPCIEAFLNSALPETGK